MDRGAWWATVHGVAKSRTRLSDFIHSFILVTSFLFIVRRKVGLGKILLHAKTIQRNIHEEFLLFPCTNAKELKREDVSNMVCEQEIILKELSKTIRHEK